MFFSLLLLHSLEFSFPPITAEECDFREWVKKINISIPDISQTIEILLLDYQLNITGLFVHNLDISEIKATFYPDPETVGDAITLKLDIDAEIEGRITLTRTLIDLNATFDGVISHLSMSLTFTFTKDPITHLITAVTLPQDQCVVTIGDLTIDIHAESSGWQFIIDIFHNMLVNILKDKIQPLICETIPDFLGTELGTLFNAVNQVIIPYLNGSTPYVIPVGEGMTDLRTSTIVDFLRYALSNITGINGPLNFNSLFNRFTNNTGSFALSSILNYFDVPLPFFFSIPVEDLNATINMSIPDISFGGLNTWDEFEFLTPIDAYELDTNTSLQNLDIHLQFSMNITVDSSVITTGDSYLREDASLNVDLDSNHMDLRFQLANPQGSGLDYTNSQCLDLNCLMALASPNGTALTMLDFNTSINNITLLAESEAMDKEVRDFFNNIIKFFVDNYKEVIPAFLNGFINEFAVKNINNLLNQTLTENHCDYIEDPPYRDFQAWPTAAVLGASCAVMILLYVLMSISDCIREKKNILNTTPLYTLSFDDELNDTKPQDSKNVGYFAAFFRTDDEASLLMTKKLPLWVRLFMPFLILLNFSLFVSSNTGIGASVFPKFFIGTQKEVSMQSMFDFGLINSVIDMWKAKAYFLSVLIMVLSCLWPYTKLVMMFFIWIAPTTIIKPKIRERLLKMLDALGKWSLLDSFIMIIMTIAFHFDFQFPIIGDQVKEAFSIVLYVYPAYGFLTLMLATIFSLALSHFILALDRYVDNTMEEHADEPKEYKSLFTYCNSPFLKVFVIVTILVTMASLGAGMYYKSFSFAFVGLIGWVMELLGYSHVTEYSVLDLPYNLPLCAEYPNSFTIRFTQVLYYIITIIMPMVHMITMLCLWLVPMTRKLQLGIYKAAEVMYAWACLDVFIIAILATIMEISQLARFMVGDKCDMVDPIVQMFFADEPLIEGHENCFDVLTILLSGCWLLFAAGILHNVCTIIVNIFARRALEERSATIASISAPSTLTSKPLLGSKYSSGAL